MKRLVFRADGNAQLGLGHLMRCLALADMLKGAFSMRFAVIEPTEAVQNLIRAKGLAVSSLPAATAETSFLRMLEGDEIVVLDGYSFSEAFQQSVQSRARRLIFIDDLVTGYQVADVVINHSGGITAADYEASPTTQFCLGPHFALLRPEFLRPDGFGEPPTDGPIFVSLGGADPQNVSLQVLEAIRQAETTRPVHLILGPFHPNRAAIDAFQTRLPNLTIRQNLSADDMASELQACRLAITACSTVSYEVCAVNRPLIAIVTAENQARLANFLSDEKLAFSVNFPTLLTRLTPVIGLDQLLKRAIQDFQLAPETVADSLANQRRFFDGRSPERFQTLFSSLCA